MIKVGTYKIMDNEIYNKITIVSIDKIIYHTVYEILYSFSKRPDEKRIFSFLEEFLDGNKLEEFNS